MFWLYQQGCDTTYKEKCLFQHVAAMFQAVLKLCFTHGNNWLSSAVHSNHHKKKRHNNKKKNLRASFLINKEMCRFSRTTTETRHEVDCTPMCSGGYYSLTEHIQKNKLNLHYEPEFSKTYCASSFLPLTLKPPHVTFMRVLPVVSGIISQTKPHRQAWSLECRGSRQD